MRRWAYHATIKKVARKIKREGLEPTSKDVGEGGALFFTDDPLGALAWYGDVVFRFPWPEDAKLDHENDHGWNEFFTRRSVALSKVEVWHDGAWEPA